MFTQHFTANELDLSGNKQRDEVKFSDGRPVFSSNDSRLRFSFGKADAKVLVERQQTACE